MTHKINHANIKDWAKNYKGPLFDGILCDPPYELGFMGKSWDSSGIAFDVDMWKDLLRILKPGGHLLAFSGSRTYHRMAVAIEDAGFEIRDMIEWVYGSGFPKSLNIGKAVDKLQGNEKFKEQEIGFVKWLKSNLDCYWCSGLGVISDNEEGFGDPSSCLDCNGKGKHTIEDIDEWLGTKAQAFHFFAESDSNRQIPNAETYKILKNRLHLDNRYDDFVKKHSLLLEEIRELQGYEKSIKNWDKKYDKAILNKPKTELASEWEGYGTALKPAHESVCVAQKPLETSTETEYIISICQKLFAQIATNRSMLNPQEQKEVLSIVQWLAENNINTLEDLSEAMAILQSCIKGVTSLNIVWSWLITLAESWQAMNTSTISTRLNMITELKILDSLEWANILRSIMLPKNNKTDGLNASAYNADSLLNAVRLKLQDTLTHFADESAISKAGNQGLLPRSEPCVLARKPLEKGHSVALNVLKHGTGGLAIDKCRIPTQEDQRRPSKGGDNGLAGSSTFKIRERKVEEQVQHSGRFPSNLIHDGSDEVEAVFPQSNGGAFPKKSNIPTGQHYDGGWKAVDNGKRTEMGSGSASRFFYTAKASKSERNAGLEGFEQKQKVFNGQSDKSSTEIKDVEKRFTTQPVANHHPTVKPLSLTKYLATLIKPPTGGRLLVPFSGSGSEMIGALQAGWGYVEGVELTEEYIPIAEARIKHWIKEPVQQELV